MIKAIIFDCFGVVYEDTFGDVYRKFGGDPDDEKEFIVSAFADSHSGKAERSSAVFAKRFGVSEQEWVEELDKDRDVNNELLTYIKELKPAYKIAMLSNIGQRGVVAYIDQEVLDEHFDVVVESSKIGFAKPEARAYEITADMLGVRLDECIFIDDRLEYIEGAQHVGMKTILFKSNEQVKEELSEILIMHQHFNNVCINAVKRSMLVAWEK